MSDNCTCPTKTSTTPSCLSSFIWWTKSKCATLGDGVVNLYCALKDIAAAIREYTDQVSEKGYASALIDFLIEGGASLTDGQIINVQYAKSPFTYKVTGFGVATMLFTPGDGYYSTDDVLKFKLWDYTAGAQIGDTLVISSVQLHDKCTNEGNPIGDNIATGHIYGVKIEYTNTDAGAFIQPDMQIYIHVEPVELVTEVV